MLRPYRDDDEDGDIFDKLLIDDFSDDTDDPVESKPILGVSRQNPKPKFRSGLNVIRIASRSKDAVRPTTVVAFVHPDTKTDDPNFRKPLPVAVVEFLKPSHPQAITVHCPTNPGTTVADARETVANGHAIVSSPIERVVTPKEKVVAQNKRAAEIVVCLASPTAHRRSDSNTKEVDSLPEKVDAYFHHDISRTGDQRQSGQNSEWGGESTGDFRNGQKWEKFEDARIKKTRSRGLSRYKGKAANGIWKQVDHPTAPVR